jgi:hypothetical protein
MALGVIIFMIVIFMIVIFMILGFITKHKLLAIFLIALILFSFFTFNSSFKDKDISINNVSDLGKVVKIYFSWLGSIFANLKTISGQAVKIASEINNTS